VSDALTKVWYFLAQIIDWKERKVSDETVFIRRRTGKKMTRKQLHLVAEECFIRPVCPGNNQQKDYTCEVVRSSKFELKGGRGGWTSHFLKNIQNISTFFAGQKLTMTPFNSICM